MNFHETHKAPVVNMERILKNAQDEYDFTWKITIWWMVFTLQELNKMRAKQGDERLSYMLGFNPFLELKL